MANAGKLEESVPSTHGGIYRDGPFEVEIVSVSNVSPSATRSSKSRSVATITQTLAPKPLIVALPKDEGDYPVVQFHHGFTLQNMFYSQLISHIASHGFIVVAPQMYTVSGSDAMVEIEEAVAILNWMPTGLIPVMPARMGNHRPNFDKVALVGHSRGGKVVFGLGLGVRKSVHQYSAIVGLDPVDGMGVGAQTNPPILRFSEDSLKLGVPTLLIGTGLGPIRKNFLFPPCAPDGVSHGAFYNDIAAPAFHFVASQHGHMDFLDDQCSGAIGKLTSFVCKSGPAREPMRRFTGGIVVAFLQAAFFGETESLEAAFDSPELAPVALDRPEWKGKLAESFQNPILASPVLTQ